MSNQQQEQETNKSSPTTSSASITDQPPILNLSTNSDHLPPVLASSNLSIASKYIDPDTVAPPGCAPIDPKTNPLALLAQTCSNIGKDLSPSSASCNNNKLSAIETSSNSSNSSVGSSKGATKISPPPRTSVTTAMSLKRPRASSPPQVASSISPPNISPRQSSNAADAVTNALNALEQAVRGGGGNPLSAQHMDIANQLADLSKIGRLAEPPAKIAKPEPTVPAVNPFTAQLLANSQKAAPAPLSNSSNNGNIINRPGNAAAVDQQQLYAAYLAQLMRSCGQQAVVQQQPPSPLPPTPPPTQPPQQQQQNGNGNDIWSVVLHSYNSKQGVDPQQKNLPIRPQPRASTPGTFVCNWLVVGTQFCGKKFATKEGLVDHVSSAHCSTSNNSPQPAPVEQPPPPPVPQPDNNASPASLYQTMLYGYLSSLMGAAAKSATVSPSNTTGSSRSENSPVFPPLPQQQQQPQIVAEPAHQQMTPQPLTRPNIHQLISAHQQQHPSPPSPPKQLHLVGQPQVLASPSGFDQQQALVASFLQQLTAQQQQNHQPTSLLTAAGPQAVAAVQQSAIAAQMAAQLMSQQQQQQQYHSNNEQMAAAENFFARQALQQQRLQAAVLAAAKNSAQHF